MKKKILHIAQSNGGVCEYLKMFFKYSCKEDFDISLICSQGYYSEINNLKKLIDDITIIDMERNISIIKDIKSIYFIYKEVKRIKPDIIYCHSSKAGVLSRIVGVITKTTCIYNPHGWAFNMNTNKFKKKLYVNIEKIFSIFTYKIIAISEYEKEIAIENNICKKEKIFLINNGIDIDKYNENKKSYIKQSIKEELGIPEKSFIIGVVARLSMGKGPDIFLEVAKTLVEIYDDVYFVMVGDGEERKKIEGIINDNNLANKIKITGWVSDSYKYISIFNIAILPTRWEGFGLALAEYMISKIPVVTTNVGGTRCVIRSGIDGILTPVDDINEMVNSIVFLRENNQKKDLYVKNAYMRVIEKFDVKNLVYEHEKMFNEKV